jgi:hypothetical protein
MAEQWAFNPLVQGSTPWRPTSENMPSRWPGVARIVYTSRCVLSWPKARRSYTQQLPGGAFRVSTYAGTDPVTGRQIRLQGRPETERAAQIELGMLQWQAAAGRQPETDATAAQLMERYAEAGAGTQRPPDLMDWWRTFEAAGRAIGRKRQAALQSGKPSPPQRVSQPGVQTQATDEVPWPDAKAPEGGGPGRGKPGKPADAGTDGRAGDQTRCPACRPAGCSAGASPSRGRPVQGRRRAPRRSGRLRRPRPG